MQGWVLTHSSVPQNQDDHCSLTSGLPKSAREFSVSCLTAQKRKREWKELFRLTLALARPLLSDLAQLHYLGFPKNSQAPC